MSSNLCCGGVRLQQIQERSRKIDTAPPVLSVSHSDKVSFSFEHPLPLSRRHVITGSRTDARTAAGSGPELGWPWGSGAGMKEHPQWAIPESAWLSDPDVQLGARHS